MRWFGALAVAGGCVNGRALEFQDHPAHVGRACSDWFPADIARAESWIDGEGGTFDRHWTRPDAPLRGVYPVFEPEAAGPNHFRLETLGDRDGAEYRAWAIYRCDLEGAWLVERGGVDLDGMGYREVPMEDYLEMPVEPRAGWTTVARLDGIDEFGDTYATALTFHHSLREELIADIAGEPREVVRLQVSFDGAFGGFTSHVARELGVVEWGGPTPEIDATGPSLVAVDFTED